MTQDNSIIKVPFLPELATPIQIKNHNDKRSVLINELRYITGIPEMASTLNPKELYTIVMKPDGLVHMQKDATGYYQAVWRNEKKQIVQHARLQAVKPSFVKVASVVGSQIMLVSIAMQLNRIEKRLENIEMEFHNDRIAEIKSGVNLYNQAIGVVNSENFKLNLISNSITELNRGIEKTLASLKQQIENVPSPEISFFDNWFGNNKSLESSQKLKIAEESFREALVGIQTLAECYAINNESHVAAEILEKYIAKLNSFEIESLAKKARLVPREDTYFPEAMWLSYLENKGLISSRIISFKNITQNNFDTIEIELKPEELTRISNEQM